MELYSPSKSGKERDIENREGESECVCECVCVLVQQSFCEVMCDYVFIDVVRERARVS